jgi:hypothetical protein
MGMSAADQARARWGMGQNAPVVHSGGGDGLDFEDARSTARGLMPQLVGLDGIVRKTTLAELDALFVRFGLKLLPAETKSYNPPGQMLFYQRGRLLVRIKTKGNPANAQHRANQPHLSVGLMKDSQDLGFDAEMIKFTPTGGVQPKSLNANPGPKRTLIPVTGTPGSQQYDGNDATWAKETHFNFPPGISLVS